MCLLDRDTRFSLADLSSGMSTFAADPRGERSVMRSRRRAIVLLIVLLAFLPQVGKAQDSWLDGGQERWNAPGMAVPAAPGSPVEGIPQCQTRVRPVETAEDAAVAAQGWQLISAYERGWGITLVSGSLAFDAQCRPVTYQQFVFVDGVFAGTLAPEPMVPRSDGALTDAGISAADRLYARYDQYAPTDPLCCPSDETVVTFSVEWTNAGPVVIPDVQRSAATPATTASADVSADSATYAVCVGLGGDALSLDYWTAEEIAAAEARSGPVVRPHPVTGTCTDPAGLPLLRGSMASLSWVCLRTADNLWYGPVWTAQVYLPTDAVAPDPAIGGCPLPRDESIASPPDSQQAAATAVYLSQLEAAGDLDTLYEWLHPDAQAVVPKEAVVGWYDAEWLPRGPQPIRVTNVEFGEWTWDVTGTTYPNVATVAYEQPLEDGSLLSDVVRLVQDDQDVWRWFFGRDRAFIDAQIARFVD